MVTTDRPNFTSIAEIDLFDLIGLPIAMTERTNYYRELTSILIQTFLLEEILRITDAQLAQKINRAAQSGEDPAKILDMLQQADESFLDRFIKYIHFNKRKLIVDYLISVLDALQNRYPDHFAEKKALYEQALSLAQNEQWTQLRQLFEKKGLKE